MCHFFKCLFCKEIYNNFVYELISEMSDDILDYITLAIIASRKLYC